MDGLMPEMLSLLSWTLLGGDVTGQAGPGQAGPGETGPGEAGPGLAGRKLHVNSQPCWVFFYLTVLFWTGWTITEGQGSEVRGSVLNYNGTFSIILPP